MFVRNALQKFPSKRVSIAVSAADVPLTEKRATHANQKLVRRWPDF